MARLTVSERQILRKKKIITLYMYWMNVLHVVQWFFKLWEKIIEHSIESSSLGRQLYILDIFANRQIVHQIAYESDVICFDQLRMNRKAFSTLCIMLETRGGLKASKYLQVDEQVAMFLHVIAHHVKNRVVRFRFMRSGETISKYFHNVLHSIIRLHGELLKRPEPVLENSTDERWKWFKSHKEAAPFKIKSFPWYDDLCAVFGKDRATGKHAETVTDVVEELEAEKENTTLGEDDFSNANNVDEVESMSVSDATRGAQSHTQSDGSSKKKRKAANHEELSNALTQSASILAECPR
ncbi:uncharacterized protein LOC133028952 isoform X5 [Cannabis sativa]|uniref:uncharacterized protein LOC133028952 isoform X5 n=1 Tax=Cannabis sativa TaxID=3483 RepID=UPI0029C9CE0E|nr:uncharacterized protein LOC133028952 isoform X5 [Cannabis sativa]